MKKQQLKEKEKNRIEGIVLIILLLATTCFRIYGAMKATEVPYPSETNILSSIQYMTQNVTLDTHFYNHPDNVVLYFGLLISNAYSFLFLKGNTIVGPFSNIIEGKVDSSFFELHCIEFLRVLRCVNVFFSIGTIYLAYLIGNRYKKNFGLLAAFFFASFPSYNVWSTLVLSDTALTTILMTVVYFSICFMQTKNKKYLFLTTIISGVATVQKYPGALAIIIVIFLVCWSCFLEKNHSTRIEVIKKILTVGIRLAGLYIITVMVVAPNLVIHFPIVIKCLIFESRNTHLGADGLGFFGNIWFYLKVFMNQAGIISVLLAIMVMIIVFIRKQYDKIPIMFGIAMMVIMSFMGLHWERWSLMFHSSGLLLTALALAELPDYFQTKKSYIRKAVVSISIIIAVSILVVLNSNLFIEIICRDKQDTRIIGINQVEELDGISKENTFFESYTVFSPSMLSENKPLTDIFEKKVEYVMVSSYNYDRYNMYKNKYQKQQNFYAYLDQRCDLIFEIKPWNPNRVIMDASIYTPFKLKVGICQVVDNIHDIVDYANSNSNTLYYGPTIRLYRLTKENKEELHSIIVD